MSKPRVSDVELWTAARVLFEGDADIQIPIDGEVYRLEEGAWVEARIWVPYEKWVKTMVVHKSDRIKPGIYTDEQGNQVEIKWSEYDAKAYEKALEEKVTDG